MSTTFINLSAHKIGLSGDLRKSHGAFLLPGETIDIDVDVDALGRPVGKAGARRAKKQVRKLTQFGRRVQAVPFVLDKGLRGWSDKRCASHCRALGIDAGNDARAALRAFVEGKVRVENVEPDEHVEMDPVELSTDERRAEVARLKDEFTHTELAERFGVSVSTISRDISSMDD